MADPTNCSKDWIDVGTALLTPTIAVVGAAIGIFQWRLNKSRYKHELFDKRWEQFVAINWFIGIARCNGKVSAEEINDFLLATRGSKFLFNDAIKNFVDKLSKKADYLTSLENELESETDQENREKKVAKQNEIKKWLESQQKNLENLFNKFLKL